MVKASLTLANGTSVTLEGKPEEVKHLLEVLGRDKEPATTATGSRARKRSKTKSTGGKSGDRGSTTTPDLNEIITLIKDCDEAEAIETQILDRVAQVDRTLLPLYIVHEYLGNAIGLTSGDVNKITTNLGIPISRPNASRTLSGTASKYVIGDSVKVKGRPVRYKLSRRGVQYLKQVLAGSTDG